MFNVHVNARVLATVRQDVARDLARHQITEETPTQWRCTPKDGSQEYWFRVNVAPNAIFLTGDIGELTLLPNEPDSLAWLRGTLGRRDEISYPFSKLAPDTVQALSVFSTELAKHEISAALEDDIISASQAALLRDALEDSDPEPAWHEAWADVDNDGEQPSCREWTRSSLFRLEALRWFINHLPTPNKAHPSKPFLIQTAVAAGARPCHTLVLPMDQAVKLAKTILEQDSAKNAGICAMLPAVPSKSCSGYPAVYSDSSPVDFIIRTLLPEAPNAPD